MQEFWGDFDEKQKCCIGNPFLGYKETEKTAKDRNYKRTGGEPWMEQQPMPETTTPQNSGSRSLKRRLTAAMAALLVTALAVVSATYAWYVYNTGNRTTNVRMAAGAGANLQISNSYDGTYGSAAVLDSFTGRLRPVSTNRIQSGFQRVKEFVAGSGSQAKSVASTFEDGESSDYYKTSLFLRTNGGATDIYLSNIGFEDSSEKNPISSAIRLGLVIHEAGKNGKVSGEYIFAISSKKNPDAEYNTATGREGYVLDAAKRDGSTVAFTPYTSDAFCEYDSNTGVVTLKKDSLKLCTISGTSDGKNGEAVEIDLYIWLEGCDEDCTANLANQTLRNLAVSFAGVVKE